MVGPRVLVKWAWTGKVEEVSRVEFAFEFLGQDMYDVMTRDMGKRLFRLQDLILLPEWPERFKRGWVTLRVEGAE